jgi:hypothetical protein
MVEIAPPKPRTRWVPQYVVPIALLIATGACSGPPVDPRTRGLAPVYDGATGRLVELAHDRDGDGRYETTAFTRGARVLRVEVDVNGDGRPDRWEYYEYAGEQTAPTPAAGPPVAETITEPAVEPAAQSPASARGDAPHAVRLAYAPAFDGRITRWERYEHGALVAVADDRDRNGRPDRWETYLDGALTTLSLDTTGSGRPDRRVRYGSDGEARIESVPAAEPAPSLCLDAPC